MGQGAEKGRGASPLMLLIACWNPAGRCHMLPHVTTCCHMFNYIIKWNSGNSGAVDVLLDTLRSSGKLSTWWLQWCFQKDEVKTLKPATPIQPIPRACALGGSAKKGIILGGKKGCACSKKPRLARLANKTLENSTCKQIPKRKLLKSIGKDPMQKCSLIRWNKFVNECQ